MILSLQKNKTISFSKESFVWYCLFFFFLIPLVAPDGLMIISPALYTIVYSYWFYLSFAILLIRFLSYILRGGRLSGHAGMLFCFWGLSAMISLFRGAGIVAWFSVSIASIFPCLLIEMEKKNLDRIVISFLTWFEIIIYINLFFMLRYPNGMYISTNSQYTANWLLGYKSSFQYFLLPGVCFSLLNGHYRKQRVRMLFLLSACILESILAMNAMLIVGLAVLLVILISRLYQRTSLFNMTIYFLIVIAANILTIFFSTLLTSSALGSSVLLFFGKNATLSARATNIWPKVLADISRNWFAGYGILPNSERISRFGGIYAAIHAHNQLLEFLFIGGILLLAVFVLYLLLINKRLMKHKDLPSAHILAVSIFALFLMVIVEVFTRRCSAGIWCMLMLAFYCKDLDRQFKARAVSRLQ